MNIPDSVVEKAAKAIYDHAHVAPLSSSREFAQAALTAAFEELGLEEKLEALSLFVEHWDEISCFGPLSSTLALDEAHALATGDTEGVEDARASLRVLDESEASLKSEQGTSTLRPVEGTDE